MFGKTKTEKFLIAVVIILAVSLVANFTLFRSNKTELGKIKLAEKNEKNNNNISNLLIKTALAEEVYPLFVCPCCGKSIAEECCGMAKERKLYIDTSFQNKLSEEEVIAAYIQKYGLDSFKDQERKDKFKQKLIDQAPAERPIISLTPGEYDFGDVSQAKGVANTLFELTNIGKTDLIIKKMETSCNCTSASIIYQGQESPVFGMPGHKKKNPTDWQVIIPAGAKAQLKVYYDPNVHKNFRGTAIREISIFSNDPIDLVAKVKIELNQVD